MCCVIDAELCRLLARGPVIADDDVNSPDPAADPTVPIIAGIFAFAIWIGAMAWS